GYPGGIDAAGPGWLSLTAGGDQPDPGRASAPGTVLVAHGGPGTRGGSGTGDEPRAGRRPQSRRARARAPAAPRASAGPGGGSVWQQSLSAWREAGLEWQRPAGWAPADVDLQRTEPIPVVSAAMSTDVDLATPPSGQPGQLGGFGEDAGQLREGAGGSREGARASREGAVESLEGAGAPLEGAGGSRGDAGQLRGKAGHLRGNNRELGSAGRQPGPGRPHRRRGRTVLVAAVACVALLAVAVAGIIIT